LTSKIHYFTISNVKDMPAATLSTPGEMGVDFPMSFIDARTTIGIAA
jgi:hypothetical protein